MSFNIKSADEVQAGVKTVDDYRAKFTLHCIEITRLTLQTLKEQPQTEPLQAVINHGRWVSSCVCGGGIALHPDWSWAACFDCGRSWSNIVFPEPDVLLSIETVLRLRPQENQWSWNPPESVKDLVAENVRLGHPIPGVR